MNNAVKTEMPEILHADLALRAVVETAAMAWVAAPYPGVDSKTLEHNGGSPPRRTRLLRFAPGASTPSHSHAGGEELFVVEGEFSDERGNYPQGAYLRSPPGSAHTPSSKGGCIMLTRQGQISAAEKEHLVVETATAPWKPGRAEGVEILSLFGSPAGGEWVYLARFQPGATLGRDEHDAGEELFILSGRQEDEQGQYPAGTWVRQPVGSVHHPASPLGCTTLVRRGHMAR